MNFQQRIAVGVLVAVLGGCGGGGGGGGSTPPPPPSVVSIVAISITPMSVTTGVGIARQLTASGKYSDGSAVNVTNTATWSISDPAVATVTGGLVTGVSTGPTSAIASMGAIKGTAAVSVTANSWSSAASMAVARTAHTATLLPSGKVLVTGGSAMAAAGTFPPSLASAEIYDPIADKWSSAASMAIARSFHTATLLPGGKVLVAGGLDSAVTALSSAEIYDPIADKWSSAASMAIARGQHTATLLASGKVFVVAGDNIGSKTAELYDPMTNMWTSAASTAQAHALHTATLLPNNTVMVAGSQSFSAGSELYDPTTNTWSPVGPPSTGGPTFNHTATSLGNGKVLATGGGTSPGATANVEIYDPGTNAWAPAAKMADARRGHTATMLPSGRVLVAGGLGNSGLVASSEIYDPATNTWPLVATMASARGGHTATLLPNGSVLVAGGGTLATNATTSCELFW